MSISSLTFERDPREDVLVARLKGDIDTSSASTMRDQVVRAAHNQLLGIVLDISAVDYIDSTGVRLLVDLGRQLGERAQQLRLVIEPTSPTFRLLQIVGIGAAAPICQTVDEAVAEVRQAAA